MGELQEIEVVIGGDGTVNIRVQGISGAKCLALTEDLERLLGNNVTERILTDEYNEQCQDIEESVLMGLKIP